jgi:hypothetical protein
MTPTRHHRRAGAARLAGVLLALTLAVALCTHLAFVGPARRILAVHFAVVPHEARQAVVIWLHNTRILLGFVVFLVCAKFTQATPPRARSLTAWFERLLLRVCDALVCVWALGTATLAGVLLGAYGARQLRVFLPDGPVEMAAWALLIALYIDVRRERASLKACAARLAVVLVLLTLAAVLELWV